MNSCFFPRSLAPHNSCDLKLQCGMVPPMHGQLKRDLTCKDYMLTHDVACAARPRQAASSGAPSFRRLYGGDPGFGGSAPSFAKWKPRANQGKLIATLPLSATSSVCSPGSEIFPSVKACSSLSSHIIECHAKQWPKRRSRGGRRNPCRCMLAGGIARRAHCAAQWPRVLLRVLHLVRLLLGVLSREPNRTPPDEGQV